MDKYNKIIVFSISGVASPKKVGVLNFFLCWWAVKFTIYMHGTPPIYKTAFQRICPNLRRGLNRNWGVWTPHSPSWRRHCLLCLKFCKQLFCIHTDILLLTHHHHQHLFWKRPFLPCYARIRCLPIWSSSTHPWILRIQDVNQALPRLHPHILSKASFSSPYISPPPPPPFYRPIPNHLHSYTPDAQTTSICHASPHPPHSVHPEDCTNPHCISHPSVTPRTSISPSSVPFSPDYAD